MMPFGSKTALTNRISPADVILFHMRQLPLDRIVMRQAQIQVGEVVRQPVDRDGHVIPHSARIHPVDRPVLAHAPQVALLRRVFRQNAVDESPRPGGSGERSPFTIPTVIGKNER